MVYERIRILREENDLGQAQVAKLLNVAQNTYSQYETGKISWTAQTLVALADYYGVSIDFLLERTDAPRVNQKK